jgi:hypothetical protein
MPSTLWFSRVTCVARSGRVMPDDEIGACQMFERRRRTLNTSCVPSADSEIVYGARPVVTRVGLPIDVPLARSATWYTSRSPSAFDT